MKDDLPYFSHENNAVNHAKMKALRAQFGWDGYGRFWALNEAVARSQNVKLDLSKKVNRVTLALDLGLTIADFDSFLAFLADPDECGLIHYIDGIVTTDQTTEDHARVMADRLRKRQNGKPVVTAFQDENHQDPGASTEEHENGVENSQNGVEKTRIVEKSRREQSRVSSPEALFEKFDGAGKNPARETRDKIKSPEEGIPPTPDQFDPEPPARPSAEDFDPNPTHDLKIPRGPIEKFTPEDLDEVLTRFGSRSQEAIEIMHILLMAGDYGRFKRPWFQVKSWLAKEASALAWLDKQTGKKPGQVQPQKAVDTRGFNEPPAPPEERVDLAGFSPEDFIHRSKETA